MKYEFTHVYELDTNVACAVAAYLDAEHYIFLHNKYSPQYEVLSHVDDKIMIRQTWLFRGRRVAQTCTCEYLAPARFLNYDIKPDLIACGKGITSSLPLSAVIGRADIMGLYAPGSMTSTHSASPLAVASAVVNLKLLKKEKLPERAAKLGQWLCPELHRIQQKHPQQLGCFQGRGLVAGIQVVKPGTRDPDAATATKINVACFHKGLLMFAPVGVGGECLKVAPPLTISEAALRESVTVFEEAVEEVLGT